MKRFAILVLPLLLAVADPSVKPYALATLNVQQGATRGDDGVYRGGAFRLVRRFDPPAEHGPRDALIAFEGPGWESDKVAYRLYLDERNVPDIYGKRLPRAVLPVIGQGKDDYHEMADWGQDILQVNQSLGAGGIGVWRGKVTQLGPSKISASIVNAPGRASVRVVSLGFAGKNAPANLDATYSIAAGSRITTVDATVTGAVPDMIAGIIRHPGVEIVKGETAHWAFVGTWGNQSLAKDGLGMVLFYRHDRAEMQVGDTDISLHFCAPQQLHYAFAAAWSQEPGGIKTRQALEVWATEMIRQYERQDSRVIPALTCSMDH